MSKKTKAPVYIKDLMDLIDTKISSECKKIDKKIEDLDKSKSALERVGGFLTTPDGDNSDGSTDKVFYKPVLFDAIKDKRVNLLKQKEQIEKTTCSKVVSEMEEMVRKNTSATFLNTVASKFNNLFLTPLNETSYSFLKELSVEFKKEENKIDVLRHSLLEDNSYIHSLKETSNLNQDIISGLISIEIEKEKANFFQKVSNVLKAREHTSTVLLNASTDYPYPEKREKLANQCVRSAKRQCMEYKKFANKDYVDFEMLSMFVSDAKDHYELGKNLLLGKKKDIEESTYMDTASREGLTEEVWAFCNEKVMANIEYKKGNYSQSKSASPVTTKLKMKH